MTGSANNGVSYGGSTTLNKSNTDIGVNGNTIQTNGKVSDNESIKIDVNQQAGFETSTITGIKLNVSTSASISSSTQYYFRSTYVDGSVITSNNITYNNTGFFTANFNPTKVIDYVEFFVISANYKISSISVDYVKNLPITDDPLRFTLVGTDYDGDISNSASFIVNRIAGTAVADDLAGTSLADTISGGLGNDKIIGLAGADTLSGGAGSDKFVFSMGDSDQTDSLADIIRDYTIGAVGTGDVIDFSQALTVGGSEATATVSQASINQTTGVATFASGEGATLGDALADISSRFTTATDTAGEFAFFKVNRTGDYYLFISDGVAGVSANDVLIKLVGVTDITAINLNSGNLTITKGTYNGTVIVAPIAIDLNQDGIQYLSKSYGVTFDYNNDGVAESTAWVAAEDGLLANRDVNGNINIVFSTQAGETDLEGLAKVYDTNKDGIFDASDSAFAEFGVWQDADSDGIVDEGEFLSLADRGITSLSLTSDNQVRLEADGDVIVYGQTTYTTADGVVHIAEDVGFAVSDNGDTLNIANLIANAEAIQSITRIDQLAETDSSSSLFVELGGETYEIAATAGQTGGVEDILAQFVGSDTGANLLSDRSWTDVIDITSERGGPGMIVAEGGTITGSDYSNNEGDWTVVINSGEASIDAENNQITFASDSAENSVTIVTADGATHNIDNVDKIQWHG
jgi:hypothetical protein